MSSHYYEICALINVASAAQVNYFFHPVVINQLIFMTHGTLLFEWQYEVGKEDSALKERNCSIHQSRKSKLNNFYFT